MAAGGSMTEGAERIGRSQSATSLQIKRLEQVLGQPVFGRTGRGICLTETGQRLLPVAREVTARLDGALREINADGLRGKLRFGMPDDHGRTRLAQIVGAFSQSHPHVDLEVTCSISTEFPALLAKGQLDIAVYEVETAGSREEIVLEDPTCWVMSRHTDLLSSPQLPVALFDQACWWRDAAIASLQNSGKSYRVAFSSQSVAGVAAAVEAGVAIGLLARSSVGDHLTVLGSEHGFTPTPVSRLVINTAPDADADLTRAFKTAIRSAFGK